MTPYERVMKRLPLLGDGVTEAVIQLICEAEAEARRAALIEAAEVADRNLAEWIGVLLRQRVEEVR